ncbi:unnamed protein product [Zymoseptoria tritici ST99CH_3D7]|uniref:Uncharacterized protein n=1 Tax=Zymoseptoria tritici (strain ST99CH_3D7) TaxID=1276538 RepID=A0A1X7S1M3_ZYMT9|nr:unnamed protein product [Zymoseptoria tritici ST99CH_3D7]
MSDLSTVNTAAKAAIKAARTAAQVANAAAKAAEEAAKTATLLASLCGAEARTAVTGILSTIPRPATAAGRVFAVPELLENILVELATLAEKERGPRELQPLASLAPLHLINHTFSAALKTARMQKIMFKGIERAPTVHRLQVGWLLTQHLGAPFDSVILDTQNLPDYADNVRHDDDPEGWSATDGKDEQDWVDDREIDFSLPLVSIPDRVEDRDCPRFLAYEKFSGSSLGFPEASWRRARVLRGPARKVEVIRFSVKDVRPSYHNGECEWEATTGSTFVRGPDVTLGQLYDWYKSLL